MELKERMWGRKEEDKGIGGEQENANISSENKVLLHQYP